VALLLRGCFLTSWPAQTAPTALEFMGVFALFLFVENCPHSQINNIISGTD
jgi:hypothetical protein